MEFVIGILVAIIGGLFLANKKSQQDAVKKITSETKAKDQALSEQEAAAKAAIQELDKGIQQMKAQKEADDRKRQEDSLSLKERADRLREETDKRLKK